MKSGKCAHRGMGGVTGRVLLALGVCSLLSTGGNVAWADEPGLSELRAELRELRKDVQKIEPLQKRISQLEAKQAAGGGTGGMSPDAPSVRTGSGTEWLSINAGVRTSFKSVEDASPDGNSYSQDFAVDNMQLYMHAKLTDHLGMTFNTEYTPDTTGATAELRVLDAIAEVHLSKAFNVWLGRFIPPTDRDNIAGPYWITTYDFPFVSNYPSIFAGRDEGAAIWGEFGGEGGHFKYQIGAFEGTQGAPNGSDNLLYATRLMYNFWDPEPGYYHSTTYHGDKDILAIGWVGQWQADAAGTAALGEGNYFGTNVDFLLEKTLDSLGGGVGTFEAAYYLYDLDRAADTVATLTEGNAVMALVAYLFPNKLGPGQLQPHVRYQNFNDHSRVDVGVNYLLAGHSARLSAVYSLDDVEGVGDVNRFLLGAKFMF